MTEPTKTKTGAKHVLASLRQPKVLVMLMLGFSSGLPFLLSGNTLGYWLRDEGTSLKAIGFLSWVGIAYSLKYLWAPFIDRLDAPLLGRLGRRRGWMVMSQILIGLALFLTFFVMSPTLDKVYNDAWLPYSTQQIDFPQAVERGAKPMREFMLKQTRRGDLQLFARLAKVAPDLKSESVPFTVLVPAFVTSELKSAFQIGFLIFIPFLIIDMIVASVLMSLGMMMLSPVLVSLPFKLMLFVLADGWNLLLGSLAASFAT